MFLMVGLSEPMDLVGDSGLRHRPLELRPPSIRKAQSKHSGKGSSYQIRFVVQCNVGSR